MKKIIAAALSVLVAAFGYTIVDSTIENRVASLESEVVELREEISKNHTTAYIPTGYQTTHGPDTTWVTTTGKRTDIYEGRFFDKSDSSKSKFLLRFYSTGRIEYVSPDKYETTTAVLTTHTTTVPKTTSYTTAPFSTTAVCEGTTFGGTTATTEAVITSTTKADETTTQPSYDEYFLYLTNSSVQVSEVNITEEATYWYDNNYSLTSSAVNTSTMTVLVTYKGYTDPIFAGYKVNIYSEFRSNLSNLWFHLGWKFDEVQKSDNTIHSDGSFEYTKTYIVSAPYSHSKPINEYNGELQYEVNSVELART